MTLFTRRNSHIWSLHCQNWKLYCLTFQNKGKITKKNKKLYSEAKLKYTPPLPVVHKYEILNLYVKLIKCLWISKHACFFSIPIIKKIKNACASKVMDYRRHCDMSSPLQIFLKLNCIHKTKKYCILNAERMK
jgi:hypothetical protein